MSRQLVVDLFTFPGWTETLLGSIASDLHQIIYSYSRNRRYALKPSPLELKFSYGVEGAGPGQLRRPFGIAIDDVGRHFIADTFNDRIQVFNGDGTFLKTIGSSGHEKEEFSYPYALVFDLQGRLLVADSRNDRIQAFSPKDEWLCYFASDYKFNDPDGIAIDELGNVVTSEYKEHRVSVFNPEGVLLHTFGGYGTGPAHLNDPAGVAVGEGNTILVCDRSNHRVAIFDWTGKPITQLKTADMTGPWGCTVEKNGKILITNSTQDQIQIYSRDYQLLETFGEEDAMDFPSSMVVDKNGYVVIVDTNKHRILVYG